MTQGPYFAFGDLHGNTPNDARDLTLQVTHAGFAGVVIDDGFDGPVFQRDLLGLDTVLFELLRHQMHARDVGLFPACVAGDLDDLQTVRQGAGMVSPTLPVAMNITFERS